MENNPSKLEDRKPEASSSKRPHSDNTPPSKIEAKVPKLQPQKETTDNNETTEIPVAITTKNGSDLSQSGLETVKSKIEKMYVDIYSESRDKYPTLVGEPVINDGVIKLVSLNEFTKQWLQEKVQDMKINLNQEKIPLKLIPQKDLSTKVKCGFHVNSNIVAQNKLKVTLQNMNSHARVDKWTFYSINKTESGLNIEVGIPIELLPSIMEKDNLTLGFQSVKLHVINEKEEDKTDKTASNSIIDLDEAGSSAPNPVEISDKMERNDFLNSEASKRRHGDRDYIKQGSRTSIVDPIKDRVDSRYDAKRRVESRRRQITDENSQCDDLTAFLLFSRDQARFREFVDNKCDLAKRAIGATITEQHLVLAFLTTLPDKRISKDLLQSPYKIPTNLEDLRKRIKYYNYCERCDKVGHLPDNCWTSGNGN
ncbi:uncharacterized protein LOC128680752 [Plodia interpunctella]|uniref:uncharacterized protein LOC128680752 n=1 Tax=Plodia interpunctella TaxID=58824 RepID=UPI002367B7B9|nr:uncharacterized protein LOC128680752 [Plodia interpunctella]